MVQEVILNGRPLDLDYYPSLEIGASPLRQTPIEINGRMIYGVNINGYDYPPADPDCVLYLPGLPGQGSKIWDRSKEGNDGTITGATWVRLPNGLWGLYIDGVNDVVNCGNDSSLRFVDALTIEFWGKLVDLADGADHALFSRGFSTVWEFGTGSSNSGVADNFFLFVGNVRTRSAGMMTGNWGVYRHYMITYVAYDPVGLVKGYVNGSLVWDVTNAGFMAVNANDLEIGRRLGGPLQSKGNLALVRIYDKFLGQDVALRHTRQEKHIFGV